MRVLVTGATGYIGRRLATRLVQDGEVRVRLFVRSARKLGGLAAPPLEVAEGDVLDREALRRAASGIDVAYYLIHSMGAGSHFEQLDRDAAEKFRDACIESGVKRIIYLGGLGVKETASRHLLSRIETGEILSAKADRIQTVWIRAGIIIGSGGSSFEIVRNLSQKLPVMITPKWVNTRTQPIAVNDVIEYLFQAKDLDAKENLVVDIGAERMSFKEMMQRTARLMGLRRVMIPVPVLTPALSSYWLILFTPVPFSVASALIEGLKSETVVMNDNARIHFPRITPASFDQAVEEALIEIERNQVLSRWCDSSTGAVCDIRGGDDMADAVYRDSRTFAFGDVPPEKVFASLKMIGGARGWFTYDFLWEIRGMLDKLVGGYGLNRGRRDETELRVGDSLDFWKVVDLREGKRLLLLAQMKLPGKAWLEFTVAGNTLTQTAHFLPKGLAGRLYWYLMLPFHVLIFNDLAKSVISRARDLAKGEAR